MKIDNSFKTIFASMMIVSGLAACDKPMTAESAGKKIDQATESVSTSVSSTADKADKAITKQGKAAGQAMDDTEITALVKSALLKEPGLQSMKITVDTAKGIVTLGGSVDSQAKRKKAEKLADQVNGVNSVINKLEITK